MAKQKKVGTCALCAENRAVTREHVPPKNLFLAPRPRNTITVPVCETCNHGYHLDDEYFRVYVTAGAEPGTRQWRLWKEKVIGSSFVRGKGLLGRLNDDRKRLHEHHKIEPLRTFDGNVLADELVPLTQSFTASRINAVVQKIVRCLHFTLDGTPLARQTSLTVSVTPLTAEEVHKLYNERSGCVGHNEEFVFHRELRNDGQFRWLLSFYRHHTFTVTVDSSTLSVE